MNRSITAAAALLAATLGVGGAAIAAESTAVISAVGGSAQLPATLLVPDGAGPFPAVVILHDCSGLGPRSSGAPRRWGDELIAQGYVVLIPDSFGPRGLPNGICTEDPERTRAANALVRAGDAYGALAYLRTLPQVDGKRVGVMGGSHGGFSTLASMYAQIDRNNPLGVAKRDGFAAAIALYPACGSRFGTWIVHRTDGRRGPITGYAGVYQPIAPLLILIGEADDWTPAEPCIRLAEASKAAGYPVEIKVYPGAHHSFDSAARVVHVPARNNVNAPTGKGATTGGQVEAWADAKVQVRAFFARHLKGRS
jgi:dienelactone hydrolase